LRRAREAVSWSPACPELLSSAARSGSGRSTSTSSGESASRSSAETAPARATLLRALLGELPLARGRRTVGAGVVIGELDQDRALFAGEEPLLERFRAESELAAEEARTLLAKFGIRGGDASRAARSLSPGERSRAVLASLQTRGVNCLVLDEPTNHLDLEAIEQLEEALADYAGTVLLVTHDRRFLERFAPTRTVQL
jgi:ATPase subunit of ABC transporter with duplicated ATPase domains